MSLPVLLETPSIIVSSSVVHVFFWMSPSVRWRRWSVERAELVVGRARGGPSPATRVVHDIARLED